MSRETLASMHDARDAEDKRLLETGDHTTLLAGQFHLVRQRCQIKLRNADAADDVMQAVFLRLAEELARGRTYSVPFRVVVWKVIDWTIADHFAGKPLTVSLPETWDPAAPGDDFADWAEMLGGGEAERLQRLLSSRRLRDISDLPLDLIG